MKQNTFLQAAVSGLLLASACSKTKAPEAPSTELKSECYGINACKGQSECAGYGNFCSGKNTCKGTGWLSKTKAECEKAGGRFKTPKQG